MLTKAFNVPIVALRSSDLRPKAVSFKAPGRMRGAAKARHSPATFLKKTGPFRNLGDSPRVGQGPLLQ
jgi:hypothetical protein